MSKKESTTYKQFELKSNGEDSLSNIQDAFFGGGAVHNIDFQRSRVQNIKNAPVTKEMKCAETINAGDAVAVGSAGELYQASASNDDFRLNNFIGFAVGAGIEGDVVEVYVNGAAVVSGLSAGSLYYLSNGQGGIGTSVGNFTLKVGRSISDTELIIINEGR